MAGHQVTGVRGDGGAKPKAQAGSARSCPALVLGRQKWTLLLLATSTVHCGARTGLEPPPPDVGPPPVLSCQKDKDCADSSNRCQTMGCVDGFCDVRAEVDCPSLDVCSVGECNPDTGACELSPVAPDEDGDGFFAVLPGQALGSPGACGDDCDDTDPISHPGGEEVCDGRDNDCDGVIDNGIAYLTGVVPEKHLERVAGLDAEASKSSSLVMGEEGFVAGYWAQRQGLKKAYLRSLPAGALGAIPETRVTAVNAESFGPALASSGNGLAAAVSDNRLDGSYEVFLARFNLGGEKLGPDLRLTSGDGMSVGEQLVFQKDRYLVVYQDGSRGLFSVFGRMVGLDGALLTDNILLSDDVGSADGPVAAATDNAFGIASILVENDERTLGFRTFDRELQPLAATQRVARGARFPSVTALGNRFLVIWETSDAQDVPGPNLMGAVLSERGDILVTPQALTDAAPHARTHAAASLGDRFILFWADDRTGNYELYGKVLSSNLTDIERRVQLTNDPHNTLAGYAALGPSGAVGIVFDDERSLSKQTYFTTVGCAATPACDCGSCQASAVDCAACCVR